jgi:hypothetical protein
VSRDPATAGERGDKETQESQVRERHLGHPAAYDGLLEVQVSRDNVRAARPEVQAVMNALTRAGVKHRTRPFSDPDIGHGMIVVLIGSRSPDAVNPDDCLAVPFKADKITDKPCTMIAQTTKVCLFAPP